MKYRVKWVFAVGGLFLGLFIGYAWGESAERSRILELEKKSLQKDIDGLNNDIKQKADSIEANLPEVFKP